MKAWKKHTRMNSTEAVDNGYLETKSHLDSMGDTLHECRDVMA